MAFADRAVGQQPPPHPAAARHLAALVARKARRLCRGVRRHHHPHPGATRRRLGRGGAAHGARDQEPAHAHPARGRAHPPQVPGPGSGGGARHAGTRHAHDYRAGGFAQEHGQRLLRIRALGADAVAPGGPERPHPRRGRALQELAQRRRGAAAPWRQIRQGQDLTRRRHPARSRRARPTRGGCARCCTTCCSTRATRSPTRPSR